MTLNVQLILELVDRMSGPMRAASASMKGLGTSAKAGGSAATATFGTMTTKAAAFAATAAKVDAVTRKFGSTLASTGAAAGSLTKLTAASTQLSASLRGAATAGSALAAATRQEVAAANAATAAMQRQGVAARALAASQRLAGRAGRVGASLASGAASGGRAVGGAINRAEDRVNGATTIIPGVGAGGMIGLAGLIGSGALLKSSAKAAIDFEAAMAGVNKVVDFDEPDGLKKLSADVWKLSRELPVTAVGIAQMVAAGGQAGIKSNELIDFARDATKVSVAFDMTAEEAGETMAKLRNIYRTNQAGVVSMADAINVLGNTTNAKEKDIIEVLSRAGAAGKDLGLSAQQTSAFAAALLSAGTQSHVVATGLSAMMTKLSVIKKGGDMEATLGDIGLNTDKFRKTMDAAPLIGLLEVLEKINKLEGSKKKEALLDMFGLEYQDDVSRLANALPDVVTNLQRVADRSTMIREAFGALGGKGAEAGNELLKGLSAAGKNKATDAILKSLGVNSKAFAEAWEKDPGDAALYFLDQLGKAKDQEALLKRIPAQYRDGVREIMKNREQLRDFYRNERDTADRSVSGSMDRETAKRMAVTDKQLALLSNRFTEIKAMIGVELLPTINDAATGLKAMFDAAGAGDDRSSIAGAVDHLRAALTGLGQGAGFKDFQEMMVGASKAFRDFTNAGGKESALGQTLKAVKEQVEEIIDLFNSARTGWQRMTGQKVDETPEAELARRERENAKIVAALPEADKGAWGNQGARSTRLRNLLGNNDELIPELRRQVIARKAAEVKAGADGVRRVPTMKIEGGSRQPLSGDGFKPDLAGSFARQDKALGGPFGSSFNGSKPSLGAGSASGGALGGIDESTEGAKARVSAAFQAIGAQARATGEEMKRSLSVTARPEVDASSIRAALADANALKSVLDGVASSAAAAVKGVSAASGRGRTFRRDALTFDIT